KGINKGDDTSGLWEEIQKLGGDMEDLNMLQDIDTDRPGKPEKAKKIDKAALQSDLSAFAKSLGLSTSISDMVGGDEDKKKGSETGKKSSKEPKQKNKDKKNSKDKQEVTKPKPKPDADSVDDRAKAEPKKAVKPAKKPNNDKKANDSDNDKKEDKAIPEIPGFKIKSAKDAVPQSKA
ncbi:hypothetical protein EV175_007288, partial [Coemansia sp. RSA 1933]